MVSVLKSQKGYTASAFRARRKRMSGDVAATPRLNYGRSVMFQPAASSSRSRARPALARTGTSALRAAIVAALVSGAATSRAEERGSIEIEPLVEYVALKHGTRPEYFAIGGTYGYRFGAWMPYAGGSIGFFGLRARGGVAFMPGDLEEPTFIVRLEARPQIFYSPCIEPAVLGVLGPGWRWPMERGDPGNPGTAFYLLGNFIGGAGWVRDRCGEPDETKLNSAAILGGSVMAGFDW